MSLEEKTKEIVNASISTIIILGSIMVIGYMWDLKYGKRAEEQWRLDSIRNDSIHKVMMYKAKEKYDSSLKLKPKVLMYPNYEVNRK